MLEQSVGKEREKERFFAADVVLTYTQLLLKTAFSVTKQGRKFLFCKKDIIEG